MEKLRAYLAEHGMSQAQFARSLSRRVRTPVQQSSVSRWCAGAAPYRLMRRAIERETGGAVPADSWPERGIHTRRRQPGVADG